MKTFRYEVVLEFSTDDEAFDNYTPDELHDALCRAYPLMYSSELEVTRFIPLETKDEA